MYKIVYPHFYAKVRGIVRAHQMEPGNFGLNTKLKKSTKASNTCSQLNGRRQERTAGGKKLDRPRFFC